MIGARVHPNKRWVVVDKDGYILSKHWEKKRIAKKKASKSPDKFYDEASK